jgi:hypothetical protein
VGSIAEAATLEDSAFGRVIGKRLSPIVSGDADATSAFLATVVPAGKAGWATVLGAYQDKLVLVPDHGAGDAFWVIDPKTGAATAMLRDGTGGAVEKCGKLNGADRWNIGVGILGFACVFNPIPYVCVGLTVLSAVLTATSVILNKSVGETTTFSVFSGVFGASGPGASLKPPIPVGGGLAVVGVIILLTLISFECFD